MERAFDIRIHEHREALADLLPTIDNRTFQLRQQEFIDALADLAFFLKNPGWLIYQWGCFVPVPTGRNTNLVFSLPDAVELGIQLRHFSQYKNFDRLMEGFFNPTQFEAKLAFFFSNLPSVSSLVFSPEYVVRGKIKYPDFEVAGKLGTLIVECKRPHGYLQKATLTFQDVVSELETAMKNCNWPSNLRLEVEFVNSIKKAVPALALETVEVALRTQCPDQSFSLGPFRGYVVERTAQFRIIDTRYWTDVMILDKDVPTGLLNPEFTSLRVVNNKLGAKMTASIGARVKEALRQLPKGYKCMIWLGDVPFQIAEKICGLRLNDSAYSHIQAFGVWDGERFKFIYREQDKPLIQDLVGVSL
jgi:hypothetical protein